MQDGNHSRSFVVKKICLVLQNLHIVFRDEASFPVQLALQPARLSGMGHCRGTAQEHADGGHHASTSLCARSDRMNSFNVEREARACLDSLSFHKQFDTSVKVQTLFLMLCFLKSPPRILDLSQKKFWESTLKNVNTFCQQEYVNLQN